MSLCGAVVKELRARADKLGSTPGDDVFCFFVPFFFFLFFFFLTVFFPALFQTLFFLLALFSLFLLLTLVVMHLDQYIS